MPPLASAPCATVTHFKLSSGHQTGWGLGDWKSPGEGNMGVNSLGLGIRLGLCGGEKHREKAVRRRTGRGVIPRDIETLPGGYSLRMFLNCKKFKAVFRDLNVSSNADTAILKLSHVHCGMKKIIMLTSPRFSA